MAPTVLMLEMASRTCNVLEVNMVLWHVQPKTTHSNRWGTVGNASGKEESQSSSEAAAFGLAIKLAADQQQLTSRRGFSNNLRGTHDPVLGFGGKMKSLESIQKDIFRSADSLRLSKGQESRAFHRENFLDQNAVIRSASAYADLEEGNPRQESAGN